MVIAVGVAVGVTVSNNNKKKGGSSNLSSSSSSNGTGVVQSDPNDPSSFTKDSRLKQSFYGLAYTPANTLYPDCNGALPDIIEDIQLMSQLTSVGPECMFILSLMLTLPFLAYPFVWSRL